MLPRLIPRVIKYSLICCAIVIFLLCGYLLTSGGKNAWIWGRRDSPKRRSDVGHEIYVDAGRLQRLEGDQARVGKVVIVRSKSRDVPEVGSEGGRGNELTQKKTNNTTGSKTKSNMMEASNETNNNNSTHSHVEFNSKPDQNVSINLQHKSSLSHALTSSNGNASVVPKLTLVSGNRFTVHSGLGRSNATNEGKVLVIVSSSNAKTGRSVLHVIQSHRIPYSVLNLGTKTAKVWLTKANTTGGRTNVVGRFGVLVFESVPAYTQLSGLDVQLMAKYCQDYGVGQIVFALDSQLSAKSAAVGVKPRQKINQIALNPKSPVLRLFRRVTSLISTDGGITCSTLKSNDNSYQPVLMGLVEGQPQKANLSLLDQGHTDGIQKVWMGGDPTIWINWLLFLDSMFYLSKGSVHMPLERYIQVDIDDIFTGKSGIRLTHEDVSSLIKTQDWLASKIPGFRFNLGFSGGFYQRGTPDEQLGDRCLVGNASRFQWFDHMLTHMQPHKFDSVASLVEQMERNRQFAVDHNLKLVPGYVVSPHHSGVYPVHVPLYEAWKKVYNVSVTSTEGYPSAEQKERRGFVFRDVMVRDICVCIYVCV